MSNNYINSDNYINYGMVMQIISGNNNQPRFINQNYAVGCKLLDFNSNKVLELTREYDAYDPQYIVINLFSNVNHDRLLTDAELTNNVCQLFYSVRLVLQISEQTVLQLPFSLLHELKPAEIFDNKIYIRIPFLSLFDKISVRSLYNSSVNFVVQSSHEISNYAESFSIMTKVYMHNNEENQRLIINDNCKLISQISTLYVANSPSVSNNRDFQINTSVLNGLTKGFLIQCCIQELTSIKFYINNLLRFEYNRFLILTACVKISDNLLYMPFNNHTNFEEIGFHTFSGAINLSRLENSTLCLLFSRDQPKVVIHNVYENNLRCQNGLGGLLTNNFPAFIESNTTHHPIIPIIGRPPNAGMLDMSGNYIANNTNNYNNPINISSNTGATGPSVTTVEYPIPNGMILYLVINTDRSMCNISHEEILGGQRYMTCYSCNNNFLENAIKQWLRYRNGNLRTCPTCREVWTNFNVYINS